MGHTAVWKPTVFLLVLLAVLLAGCSGATGTAVTRPSGTPPPDVASPTSVAQAPAPPVLSPTSVVQASTPPTGTQAAVATPRTTPLPGTTKPTKSTAPSPTAVSSPAPTTPLLTTFTLRKTFQHGDEVTALAYSPDGKTLATGGGGGRTSVPSDYAVTLWDAATGKKKATFTGFANDVASVAFSPDGNLIVASGVTRLGNNQADIETGIKVWNARNGKLLQTFPGVGGVFSPDSMALTGVTADGVIHIWDVGNGHELFQVQAQKATSLAYSPDGKTLVVSGDDGIRLLNAGNGKTIRSLPNSAGPLVFRLDGEILATGGSDGIKLWDVSTGTLIGTLTHQVRAGTNDSIVSLAFSPDGKLLAGASFDGTVKLWDVAAQKEIAPLEGHTDQVNAVAFSPDGKTLASGSADQTITLWQVRR